MIGEYGEFAPWGERTGHIGGLALALGGDFRGGRHRRLGVLPVDLERKED